MSNQVSIDFYDPAVEEAFRLIQKWHSDRIQKLQMIVDASADTTLALRGVDGRQIILIGDERKGFKAGAATALSLFGKLPFEMTEIMDNAEDEAE